MSTAAISDAELASVVDPLIEAGAFSGVLRIDRRDAAPFERATGMADRRCSVPMTTATRLSIASGTKGFTALVVLSLVESGALTLDTTARSLLGSDLPLIDDGVTVEHLLGHRSGIGDYIDEAVQTDITDHVMPISLHLLDSAESYVQILDGYAQVSEPGSDFVYNNSGFVVLAVLAERAAGRPYHALVDELVIGRAGLADTGFIRSDSLPPGVATGYLDRDGWRTNALHLPVLGVGDGGLFSTTADMLRFWTALFAGELVAAETVRLMCAPRSTSPSGNYRYGLGFWLFGTGPAVHLEGYDAGVSFRTVHDPDTATTYTVISNTSEGAWELCSALKDIM
jgi:CubicO group peptidase (beta-lactamase class C family)